MADPDRYDELVAKYGERALDFAADVLDDVDSLTTTPDPR